MLTAEWKLIQIKKYSVTILWVASRKKLRTDSRGNIVHNLSSGESEAGKKSLIYISLSRLWGLVLKDQTPEVLSVVMFELELSLLLRSA